jgi:hypothetical protein
MESRSSSRDEDGAGLAPRGTGLGLAEGPPDDEDEGPEAAMRVPFPELRESKPAAAKKQTRGSRGACVCV